MFTFFKKIGTLSSKSRIPSKFLCQTNFELKSKKKKNVREREWKSETGKKLKVTFDNSLSMRWITHETLTFTMFTYLQHEENGWQRECGALWDRSIKHRDREFEN